MTPHGRDGKASWIDTPDIKSAILDLTATRSRLVTYGWCRQSYGVRHGPCCLLGALNVAVEQNAIASLLASPEVGWRRFVARDALRRSLPADAIEPHGPTYDVLVGYNDAQRDVTPVLAVIDRATELLQTELANRNAPSPDALA